MAERNPIRYWSYYYDTETGFYYLQSRYYDPQTGRFINADGAITTGQGLVSYNVCFTTRQIQLKLPGQTDCWKEGYV